MPSAAVLRGTGAVTSDAHSFSFLVDGTDLYERGVQLAGTHISEAIGDNGSLEFSVHDPDEAISISDWSEVTVDDNTADRRLFGGYVVNRKFTPIHGNTGRWIDVDCVGYGILLDRIVSEAATGVASTTSADFARQVQRVLAQVAGLGQLTYFSNVDFQDSGTGAPTNVWETVMWRTVVGATEATFTDSWSVDPSTVRQMLEEMNAVAERADVPGVALEPAQAIAQYVYVDHQKRIHIDWVGEQTGNAPKEVTDNPLTGSQVAAESMHLETDASEVINSVYVVGSSPATSTFVRNAASIALYGERMAVLDKSTEATSLAKARRYGRSFLADKKDPIVRGSFTITGVNGWRPRQQATITDSKLNLSAATYLIQSVDTVFLKGDGTRKYTIGFGGSLRRSVARDLRRVDPQT
jgi:hypothetical protein